MKNWLKSAFLLALGSSCSLAQTVPQTNITVSTRACQPPYDTFPFCDVTKSLDVRVKDLISRILDADITPQLTARHGGGDSPGPKSNLTYLGIPEYDWGTNSLHGVQSSCISAQGTVYCPTSFPNSINYGTSWNLSQVFQLGAVIAQETRALWLAGAVEASDWSGRPHIGLDAWSPNINLNREPRWGRNAETASEDPNYNGQYGKAYTMGIQTGEDSNFVKVAVTLKHWDAYSLEDADGYQRYNFNAIVSDFALADSYWPAWEISIVEGGALGVMCSYNAINGVPSCANQRQSNVMRNVWNFTGYITSDTPAIDDIYLKFPNGHGFVDTVEEAACLAIRNGTTDVCSGAAYHDGLLNSVTKGFCSRDDINAALYRTFMLRFKLGLFDPIEKQPYWNVPITEINTPESENLNIQVAKSSMVLLKNNQSALPLPIGKKIAIIGPHANSTDALLWNYLGQICPSNGYDCIMSPFTAISNINVGGTTSMAAGCKITDNSTAGFAEAIALAQASDIVILALGIDSSVETESHDRTEIDLPPIQHQLASVISNLGVPTVMYLIHAGSVDISPELSNPNIMAVLDGHYPGKRGSEAIASTLFGQNDLCCGKLSYTVYPASFVNTIAMSDMELDGPVGRGYRYYAGPTVLPFGFGLSLTTFQFADISTSSPIETLLTEKTPSRVLSYSVNVTNTGASTGDDVVFLFMEPTAGSLIEQKQSSLLKKLIDFQRVHLAPGASQVVTFDVSSASFRLADKKSGDLVSTPGEFKIVLTNGATERLDSHMVRVEGSEVLVSVFPANVQA